MKALLYAIIFFLLITGCDKDDEIYSTGNGLSAQVNDLIKIESVSTAIIPGDNVTTSVVKIKVHPETDSLTKKFYVSVIGGTLLNGKTDDIITADANGNASVQVISATPGTLTLSAKVKSVLVTTAITVIPSLPDDMILAENMVIDTNSSATITANLLRDPFRGTVNDPCKVTFKVSGTGSEVLALPESLLSSDKKAILIIKNPSKIKGNFVVEASTPSSKATMIIRTIKLTIQ